MCPRGCGQLRRPAEIVIDVRVRVAGGAVAGGVRIEAVGVVAGPLLEEHGLPVGERRRPHPCFERHAAAEVEGGGVGDRDDGVVAVEGERVAVPAGARSRPGRARERAVVAAAGLVDGGRAGAFVEPVGGDEADGRGSRHGRAGLRRGGADVARRILRGDAVEVGAGGETGVRVARAGGLRDAVGCARREAARRRPVQVVAHDADVVRGSRPGERGLSGAARGYEPSRRAWGNRVRDGRRGGVRDRADVSGRVLGRDLVEPGAWGEAVVGVVRPCGLGDPVRDARREAARRAAMDVVAEDADVVGRRGPRQRDGVGGHRPRESGRSARRSRVRDRGAGRVRDRADVARRVFRGDLVEPGAGGEARISVARARRLSDPVRGARREAARRAAMDVVAEHADVVARGSPGEVDGASGCARRERSRCRRSGCVRGHGRSRLVRRRADVAGAVLGEDLVEVAAGRRDVGVARAGRLGDAIPRGGGEACRGPPVDVVACNADVVGRGAPRQRRPADAARRNECARCRGRDRVADGRTGLVRHGTDVAGRVLGGHPVEVRARRDRVRVARAGGLGDPVPAARRKAGDRAAMDVVARDPDVVGRGTPRELSRGESADRGQRPRCGRRRRVGVRHGAPHVRLDLADRERAIVDPHLVDLALEPLRPDRVAADAERAGAGRDRPGREELTRLDAVHVEHEHGPVVGGRDVRPRVDRQSGAPVRAPVAGVEDLAHRHLRAVAAARVERVREGARPLLHERRAPRRAERGRPHPRLERHPGRQVELVRVGHRHDVVDTVEGESAAEAARGGPRRAAHGARVAAAGLVRDRRARALLEAVGRHEPRRRAGRDVGASLVGGGADVARAVLGGDAVVVGAAGEARVRVARAGRLGDPVSRVRDEAGRRRAVDVVARDAACICRGRPGERHLSGRAGGGERPRRGRRCRIGRRGRARLVRRGAGVAGRVEGDDAVVVGAGGEPCVRVVRAGRLRDPVRRARGEAGDRAPMDVVAGDADVVRRGSPGERDLAETARGGQGPRRTGRNRVGIADRGRHVGLDLGGAERPVVDADLVDQPVEPLAPDRVAADLQRRGRRQDRPRARGLRGLGTVHVQPLCRAVEGCGEVRPRPGGHGCRPVEQPGRAADRHLRLRPVGVRARVEAVHEVAGALLHDHRGPVAGCGRPNPALDRHPGGEVERGGVGHGDEVVRAVEGERATEAPSRCPRRAGDRPGVPVAGLVRRRAAAARVEAPGGHRSGRAGRRERRTRLVGGRADATAGILGGDAVVVRARRETGIDVARHGRLCDPVRRARREPGSRRAVHVVARDAVRVGRRAPAERDLTRACGRRERRGGCGRHSRRLGVAGDADEGGHRRDALAVDDEEHVVARRCEVRVRRSIDGQRAGTRGEVEELEALVHVQGMRDRRQPDQRDLGDSGRVRCGHLEARPVLSRRGCRCDHRAGALEEVGRRVDLCVALVDRHRAGQGAAAGHQHAAVGEQHRGGVVEPAVLERVDGRPRLGVGIPDLGREDGVRDVAAVGPVAAAARQHRPVGKQRQRVVGAAVGHRRGLSPGGGSRIQIDHGGPAVRGVRVLAVEVRIGPGAGLHDLVRPVHHGAVTVERARSDRRPRPGRRVDDA